MIRLILVDSLEVQSAQIEVEYLNNGRYSGHVKKSCFDIEFSNLLLEYEKAVNLQVLSLLDKIETKIDNYQLKVRGFNNDFFYKIIDVQIFSNNSIYFKVEGFNENILNSKKIKA